MVKAVEIPMVPRLDSPVKPKPFLSDYYQSRLWVFVTILSVQLVLLLSSQFLPVTFFSSFLRRPSTVPGELVTNVNESSTCSLGRIYVYDLPPAFNAEILSACDDLNPWNSRCSALSNYGFGLQSVDMSSVIPASLLPAWYATDQFAGEVIYHRRILAHPCRTTDPYIASAFYIPFYAGLAVGKYLWGEKHNYTARDRDRDGNRLLEWIERQPQWKKSGGWDHFLMVGRITWDFRRSKDGDWGSSFLHMNGMENVTRLLIERNPWDELDVGVPYPTGFHPRTMTDVRQWQDNVLTRNRTTLFCFAGAARSTIKNDFRGLLLSQCAKEKPPSCKSVDCSKSRCANKTGDTLGLFLESKFCLQPRGDSFTRRSIFDCMIAGAIPVFFWKRSAYVQYEWFLPVKQEEFSVLLDRRGVRNGTVVIREVLEKIGEEKVRKMRETVVGLVPRLVYAMPEFGLTSPEKDAFGVAVDGVLKRFRGRSSSTQS